MRVPRSLLFLAVLAAVPACGGSSDGGTAPPPPLPSPPITRIELTTASALVFLGHQVPARAFVAHAYDSTGAEVPNAVFSIARAPAGWTIRGDTVVAPLFESAGTLRLAAARPATPSARLTVHLSPLADSTAPADSLTVTSAIDLRAYQWRARWRCTGGYIYYDGNWKVDSAAFDGAVTSWQYPGDSLYFGNYGGVAQVAWSGERTLYLGDSVFRVDSIPPEHLFASVFRQAPDSLLWYNPSVGSSPETGNGQWPAPLVSADTTHRIYEGGNWCMSGQTPLGKPTLEQVPAAP